jgi:hypothetical protein
MHLGAFKASGAIKIASHNLESVRHLEGLHLGILQFGLASKSPDYYSKPEAWKQSKRLAPMRDRLLNFLKVSSYLGSRDKRSPYRDGISVKRLIR